MSNQTTYIQNSSLVTPSSKVEIPIRQEEKTNCNPNTFSTYIGTPFICSEDWNQNSSALKLVEQ